MSRHPYEILDRPILTEKATEGQDAVQPKYTFKVPVDANKIEIRQAIETAFKVKVVKVNTVTTKGKRKRQRTVRFGRTPMVKKAIVTLAEGDSINLI